MSPKPGKPHIFELMILKIVKLLNYVFKCFNKEKNSKSTKGISNGLGNKLVAWEMSDFVS